MKTSAIYNDDFFNVIKDMKKPVDMILFDPPYGTSAANWDKVIDFTKMWKELYKVLKPNGVIAVFSATPFDKMLAVSNIKKYKYEYIWIKEQGTNQLNAKKQPLRKHENILIFYKKKPTYNIQFSEGKPYHIKRNMENVNGKQLYGKQKNETETVNTGFRYPTSTLHYNRPIKGRIHPTQKPIELLEFLIKTYTNESETVLDICMGSGSTGIAALNTNRNFIGIESSNYYFNKAKDWLFSITKWRDSMTPKEKLIDLIDNVRSIEYENGHNDSCCDDIKNESKIAYENLIKFLETVDITEKCNKDRSESELIVYNNLINDIKHGNHSSEMKVKFLILSKCSFGDGAGFYPGRGGLLEKETLEFVEMFVESSHLIELLGYYDENDNWNTLNSDQLEEYFIFGTCSDDFGHVISPIKTYKIGPQAFKEWNQLIENIWGLPVDPETIAQKIMKIDGVVSCGFIDKEFVVYVKDKNVIIPNFNVKIIIKVCGPVEVVVWYLRKIKNKAKMVFEADFEHN